MIEQPFECLVRSGSDICRKAYTCNSANGDVSVSIYSARSAYKTANIGTDGNLNALIQLAGGTRFITVARPKWLCSQSNDFY
uniref:Uncharacterized protein n=1 Tax=mine drainage metagenome TaxID=410659 RepID=E6Q8L7_9ZZZZ